MKIQLINWYTDCTPVLTIQAFMDNEDEVIFALRNAMKSGKLIRLEVEE